MPTKKCPIRNPHIEEDDLHWDSKDEAECFLESEGVRYKITIEAFKRISVFSTPSREKLAEWVFRQDRQRVNVPTLM